MVTASPTYGYSLSPLRLLPRTLPAVSLITCAAISTSVTLTPLMLQSTSAEMHRVGLQHCSLDTNGAADHVCRDAYMHAGCWYPSDLP